MSIQALREQRAAKAKELQDLVNNPAWDTARDQPIYDAGILAIEDIDSRIERHQKMNELAAETALRDGVIDAALRIGQDQKSVAANLFAKWLRGGDRALTEEEWAAHNAAIRNTMSTTTPSEGGYTVQTEVAQQVVEALKAFGGMRSVATVMATAQGNPMNWPTSDATSEEGEILEENATATDADTSFGVKSLPVYKYLSLIHI